MSQILSNTPTIPLSPPPEEPYMDRVPAGQQPHPARDGMGHAIPSQSGIPLSQLLALADPSSVIA